MARLFVGVAEYQKQMHVKLDYIHKTCLNSYSKFSESFLHVYISKTSNDHWRIQRGGVAGVATPP